MNVAIVGSTEFGDYEYLRTSVLAAVPSARITSIVSGGARGADMLAERFAAELGIPKMVFPAEWNKYGRAAGPVRNRKIVAAADVVVAFPIGASKGTNNTIRLAQRAGKPVHVFGTYASGDRT